MDRCKCDQPGCCGGMYRVSELESALAEQSDGFRVAIETFKQVAAKLEAALAAEREAVRVLGAQIRELRLRQDAREECLRQAYFAVEANPIASAAVRGEGAR